MPVGSNRDPTFDAGPSGLVERFVFIIFSIIGGVLGTASAAASGLVGLYRSESLREHVPLPLSPEAAAVAVLKGAVDRGAATAEAALSGLDPERFGALLETAGNPPGPMEMVALWRRGKISRDRLQQGLHQSFIRNDWSEVYDNLRFEPVSTVEYLNAAVQGHLDPGEAFDRASENGVTVEDARMIYETLGNPPGVEQMLHLWNRGILSESDVEQGIKESHYKNKYIPAIKHLREYLPPPRTITTLVTHAAISDEQAMVLFEKAGLTHELALAYLASAKHVKTASHKQLTVTQVQELYTDRMLTRSEATDDLGRVGYAASEATLLLDLADMRARQKIKQQAVTKLRQLFVAKRIDRATAEADMAKIGVDADQARQLLDLWVLEQSIPTRTLSIGQLNTAYKKGIITEDEFINRATALGYTLDDAQLLALIDVPPTTP